MVSDEMPRLPLRPRDTELGMSICILHHFATTGTAWKVVNDAGLSADIPFTLKAVEHQIADVLECVPATPALTVLFEAARGKARLAMGHPLAATHLAALAGLSPQQVRLLSRNGDFTLPIHANEARRWLDARAAPA